MYGAGLELLFSSVQSTFHGPEDALVCVVHWNLITNGFKCLGTGEQSPGTAERKTELLPPGWNESQELYCLRYTGSDGEKFVLKIIKVDCMLLVHLMTCRDEKVTSMNVNIGDYTGTDLSSFDSAFCNLEDLQKRFKTEILGEFRKGDNPSGSQTKSDSRRSREEDPSRSQQDPLRVPPRHSQRPPPEWTDPDDPFAIGRGDLDPLAQGGGGMLMDPFRGRGGVPGFDPNSGLPGRLPRGAVPPGARFDPFGPPGAPPGPRSGPDPDHLLPPGYDDMFM